MNKLFLGAGMAVSLLCMLPSTAAVAAGTALAPGCYDGFTIHHDALAEETYFGGKEVSVPGVSGTYRKGFVDNLKQWTKWGLDKDGTYLGYLVEKDGSAAWEHSKTGPLTSKGKLKTHELIAVHDLKAFPYGTKLTLPERYGDEVFVVGDWASEKNDKLLVVWWDSWAEFKKQKNAKSTTVCVVDD